MKQQKDFFQFRDELQETYPRFDSAPQHLQAELLNLACEESEFHDSIFEEDDHPLGTSVDNLLAAIAEADPDADLMTLAQRLQYRMRENMRSYHRLVIAEYDRTGDYDEESPLSLRAYCNRIISGSPA